jgi:hypothetical protein
MTREQVSRTLMYMEHLRLSSYEAETRKEKRRLNAEYGRLWASIRPYVEGTEPFTDQSPTSAMREVKP